MEEYLISRNATQAAINAGYSKKSARAQGSRLLTDAVISAEIQRRLEESSNNLGITKDRILQELARIAFSDTRCYFQENGTLKHVVSLNDDAARALSSIESDDLFDGSGKERVIIGQTKKIKLWDKVKALELLGKNLKMFSDKPNPYDETKDKSITLRYALPLEAEKESKIDEEE